MAKLKDGMHGTVYMGSADPKGKQDGYLIASSGESIGTIGLCSSSRTYPSAKV